MVSWAYVWYRPDGRLTLEQTSDRLTALILNLAGAKAKSAGVARLVKRRGVPR